MFIHKVKSVYHGLSRFLFFERLRSILKLLKRLGLSCVKSFFQQKVGLRLQGPAHTGSFN